jgi:hypothetical protein
MMRQWKVSDVVAVIAKLVFLGQFALIERIKVRGISEHRISPANKHLGIVSLGNENTVLIVQADRFESQAALFRGLGKVPLQGARPCENKRRGNQCSF